MKLLCRMLALGLALMVSPVLAQTSPGTSPLSILKGGTGAISAAAARINLGFGSTANRLYGTDGSGVSTQVTLPAAGLTLSAGALAFANDLAALEGLSSTGIARRTGSDAWSVGTAVANSELATMAAYTLKGNNTSGSATPTDVDIAGLTTKASPASGDYVMISDQAASGAFKKATVSSLASAGSVSSIAGNTGAFTLGYGLTNSTNDLRASLTTMSNFLGFGDINLNSTSSFFDGPSVAQGTSGTWLATGKVVLSDSGGAAQFQCKLWDGTTIIDFGYQTSAAAGYIVSISLSGTLASPAGNIKISCKDATNTSGNIRYNASGTSKDSGLTVVRIAP